MAERNRFSITGISTVIGLVAWFGVSVASNRNEQGQLVCHSPDNTDKYSKHVSDYNRGTGKFTEPATGLIVDIQDNQNLACNFTPDSK